MSRKTVACVAFCAAVFGLTVAVPAPAFADGTVCTGTHTGETFADGLTVPAGQRCSLVRSTVQGNAVVGEGAALGAADSTITGNVLAEGATLQLTRVSIGNNVTSVRPTNYPTGPDVSLAKFIMCGSTVGGSVFVTDAPSFGSIRLGGTVCGTTGGNTIVGSLVDRNNSASAHDVSDNRAASMVCSGSSLPPSGSGNTARLKSGQCALL